MLFFNTFLLVFFSYNSLYLKNRCDIFSYDGTLYGTDAFCTSLRWLRVSFQKSHDVVNDYHCDCVCMT